MCSARKCCLFISLHSGCFVIATLNILMSITIGTAAIFLLEVDPGHEELTKKYAGRGSLLSILGIDKKISDAFVLVSLGMSILGLLFSSVLIYGLKKNKSSLVLSYFLFGVFQAILVFLVALLELIQMFFITSLVQIILTLLYIHGLVVIHKVYEEMWQDDKTSPPAPPGNYLDDAFLIENEVTIDSENQ